MALPSARIAVAPPSRGEVRAGRAEIVARAFGAADLLVELDSGFRVVNAAGAANALIGRDAEALIGLPATDLVIPQDRPRLLEELRQTGAPKHLGAMVVRLRRLDGLTPHVRVAGYRPPGKRGCWHLAFRLHSCYRCPEAETDSSVDTAVCADAEVGEIPARRAPEASTAGADIHLMQRRLEEFVREIAADGECPEAGHGGGRGVGDAAEVGKALVYTINRFCADMGDGFSVSQLSAGLGELATAAAARVGAYRATVAEGVFDTAFQPIINLDDGSTHHYEVLVRFGRTKLDVSPYEFITFAEQVGLIHEFDLAMCRKVLEFLSARAGVGERYTLAVNLSAASLSAPAFAASLEALLREYEPVRGHLMFEVTESSKITDLPAVNAFLQRLRRAGHEVCLDDFGSGAAAFQYLRALQVDVVKIDGGYVKNACATPEGKRFLMAMAGLLRELGITTIAEMVEDEKHLDVIKDCGFRFGQGYLFGRPSVDIGVFGDRVPAV